MLLEEYAISLTHLVHPRFLGRYIRTESKRDLLERIRLLRDQRRARVWQFSVPREKPIEFLVNEQKLQVDIAGIIDGQGNQILDVRTLLRVWSLDEALCFREGVDADQIQTKFSEIGRRVLARFHFDRRAEDTSLPEPIFHLQVGGNSLDEEYCWFPKALDIPRFCFPPMDIILLCELVLVNFFPEPSRDLREKPEWKRLVMKSQQIFQGDYINNIHDYFDKENNTILGSLIT